MNVERAPFWSTPSIEVNEWRRMRLTVRSKVVRALLTLSVLCAASSGCSESGGGDSGASGEMSMAGIAGSTGAAGDASGAGGSAGTGTELGGSAGLVAAGGTGAAGGSDAAGTGGSAGDGPSGGSSGTAGTDGSSGGATGGAGTSSTAIGPDCRPTGSVSYTLVRNDEPISAESAAYVLITAAMDLAVAYYNCYTDLSLDLEVRFDATFAIVETQGTIIRFGAMDAMNPVTAMHEIAGIAGIGSPEFAALVEDGVFTGENATAELRAITGDDSATLYADAGTFWPYGLNYPNEVKHLSDLENHCRLVVAIRKDLGL